MKIPGMWLGLWGALATPMLNADLARGQCVANEFARLSSPSPAAWDLFGGSVSISDNVALVGARGEDGIGPDVGAAYIYSLECSQWVEEARLVPRDAAAWDGFGNTVCVSGDVAMVAAFNKGNSGGGTFDGAGAVYVFRRIEGAWVEEAVLTASDPTPYLWFGAYVSVLGDAALITALDGGQQGAAAYVFRFDGAHWYEEAKLTPSDTPSSPHFGVSACISGDTAMVGALATDDDGPNSGSVYVYTFDGVVWTERPKLTASDAAAGDRFGASVSVCGDTAVVGAVATDNGGSSSGSTYVFRNDGTAWIEEAKLVASDATANDEFGIAVWTNEEIVAVGARGTIYESQPGAVYIFRFDGAGWVEEVRLRTSEAEASDLFGQSVSVSNDKVLVGAFRSDHGGPESGSAYVFNGLSDCNTNGILDICDIADGTSDDDDGNGVPDECQAFLQLDIKPGLCPNSLNPRSHGVLPVALMSTDEIDVTRLDISTVRMSRADCVGGEVAPNEGPPGPHSVVEDVGTPFKGDPCDCHEVEGDGIDDLSMKFRTADLVAELELGDLDPGDEIKLILTGNLVDGTPFEASDCISLVPGGARN